MLSERQNARTEGVLFSIGSITPRWQCIDHGLENKESITKDNGSVLGSDSQIFDTKQTLRTIYDEINSYIMRVFKQINSKSRCVF